MAYTTTNIFSRPDTSINWYVRSSDVSNHLKTTFGKRKNTSFSSTESADGLTLTQVSVFINQAAHTALMEDSVMTTFINTRTIYNLNNGIERSFSAEES
jgi:hypothetical protein